MCECVCEWCVCVCRCVCVSVCVCMCGVGVYVCAHVGGMCVSECVHVSVCVQAARVERRFGIMNFSVIVVVLVTVSPPFRPTTPPQGYLLTPSQHLWCDGVRNWHLLPLIQTVRGLQAQCTQDAGRDASATWNVFPLMLHGVVWTPPFTSTGPICLHCVVRHVRRRHRT